MFEQEYKKLNPEQKTAVDAIEGPVLVIAGPGTGKTQLLSMRVANILRLTDVAPSNILCLTFTDNAARNMRERLSGIIGQSAYHVTINTFHSFGSDIINQYPDHFTRRELLQQIDELGKYELLQEIFADLPHSNPLSTELNGQFIYQKDVQNAISWLKQNGLSPMELKKILESNQKFIDAMSKELAEVFAATPSPKLLKNYNQLLKTMQKQTSERLKFGFADYGLTCANDLAEAISVTNASGRYATAITAWRNHWCKKDSGGQYIFKDSAQNLAKTQALAEVYKSFQQQMSQRGLYDFDDMVIEPLHALESDSELRLNLQERYQYILVDEFQDTNKAQLRMLLALADNPANMNRPNIMAVGDDDQAIYAFQGADSSNIVSFANIFGAPKIITLSANYRSSQRIIKAAEAVSGQIEDRAELAIRQVNKRLSAEQKYSNEHLEHWSFSSELAQYDAIADEIKEYLDKGVSPEEIAVIAPRHKYLERLMPYLGNRQIPVAYERRENILEAAIIKQLLSMSELVVAIADNRQDDIDNLLSEALGYEFFAIPSEELIKVSLESYNKHKHWLEILSAHKNSELKQITGWFVSLAKSSHLEPMEYILDELTNRLKPFYFAQESYESSTESYLTLLGQLTTLRQRLRQWKPSQTLYVADLVEFSRLHTLANLKIIDTNPHTQTTKAVQVMTSYKAKGLEFEYVFVINAQDEVWGPTARSGSSRITLPRNLPIEPAGASDNDKLRLFFVALTRAKHTLIVTSYNHDLDNKLSPLLSFLEDSSPELADLQPQAIDKPTSAQAVEILSTDWAYRFRQVIADKKALMEPILANYKLSVTHLNNFTDVASAGPEYFLVHNLLRFPERLNPSAAYGDSIHKTMQWIHQQHKEADKLPTVKKIQDYFSDILDRKHLSKADFKKLDQRGRSALEHYVNKRSDRFTAQNIVERGFNNDGVVVNDARLSGKIDRIEFIEPGVVRVADHKTGKPAKAWQGRDNFEKIKLHKYRQQLMFYKLLVENSASFSGKLQVKQAELEFIETDEQKKLVDNLPLSFEPDELTRFATLVGAVWQRIQALDFPDVSNYSADLTGIEQFEQDLIDNKI